MTMAECMKSLGAAIVLQAYKDYRHCAKLIHCKNANADIIAAAEKEMSSIENFVRSEWYTTLTDIPPQKLLRRLREVRNG